MSTPTPPDLNTVVDTLNGAAALLSQRVELSRQAADLSARVAAALDPLADVLAAIAVVDAQIKAANIDETVAALKAFQNSIGG